MLICLPADPWPRRIPTPMRANVRVPGYRTSGRGADRNRSRTPWQLEAGEPILDICRSLMRFDAESATWLVVAEPPPRSSLVSVDLEPVGCGPLPVSSWL